MTARFSVEGGFPKIHTLALVRDDGKVEIDWHAVESAALGSQTHPLWGYATVFLAIRDGSYLMLEDEPNMRNRWKPRLRRSDKPLNMRLPHIYTDNRVWYSHEPWIMPKFGEIWVRLSRLKPPAPGKPEVVRVLHLAWIRV